MTPLDFARQFYTSAGAHVGELAARWDNKKERTAAMYQLVDEVALALGVAVCLNPKQNMPREYYGLDAVYYDGEGPSYDGYQYAWCLAAAVEIENRASNSVVEMNKLTLFNTPLKVLITFPGPRVAQRLPDELSEIVRRGDIFGDFQTHRRHLLIFGIAPQRWRYYEYRDQHFTEFVLD